MIALVRYYDGSLAGRVKSAGRHRDLVQIVGSTTATASNFVWWKPYTKAIIAVELGACLVALSRSPLGLVYMARWVASS